MTKKVKEEPVDDKLEKIIDILEENFIKIRSKQVDGTDHIIMSDNVMFLYETKEDRFNVSFHISTRPDISAMFIKNVYEDLNNIVCNINVMETHYITKQNDILYGDVSLEKYLESLNDFIIEGFVKNHRNKAILENPNYGFHC